MNKREFITYDEAVAMLPDREEIHTFLKKRFLIGADWERKDVLSLLKNAVQIELSGNQAQALHHGLAVWKTKEDVIFVETKLKENKNG